MEDGVGEGCKEIKGLVIKSLNPYFRGGWCRSISDSGSCFVIRTSLNPYFRGGWCRRATMVDGATKDVDVLILIFVEDGVGEEVLQFIDY